MPTWKQRIERADQRSETPGEYTYGPPVQGEQLAVLEERLGPLPVDLRSLLKEFNGAVDSHSDSIIWNAEEFEERNVDLRANVDENEPPLPPHDHFLFFADNGIGDYFGICLKVPEEESSDREMCPGNIPGPIVVGDIIVWMHDSDAIARFAPGLEEDVDGWFSGERVT